MSALAFRPARPGRAKAAIRPLLCHPRVNLGFVKDQSALSQADRLREGAGCGHPIKGGAGHGNLYTCLPRRDESRHSILLWLRWLIILPIAAVGKPRPQASRRISSQYQWLKIYFCYLGNRAEFAGGAA